IGEVAAARATERAAAGAAPIEALRAALLIALPIATEAIIFFALLLVRQHFVGFVDRFEFRLGLFIAGIDIRVILARQLTIRLLNLGSAGAALNPKGFIIVLVIHRASLLVFVSIPMRGGASWPAPRGMFAPLLYKLDIGVVKVGSQLEL